MNERLQRYLQTRMPNLSRVACGGDGKLARERDGHLHRKTSKMVEPASGQFGTLVHFIVALP